jgi:hypothetical protein
VSVARARGQRHSAPVEWWYFSGHLSGKDAKGHVHTYGYEYVIFQFLGFGPQPASSTGRAGRSPSQAGS